MILTFTKPPKAMAVEEWKGISADGAPPGVYVPNMSTADRKRWKAKVVGIHSGDIQIEIRKTIHGTQMLAVVNGAMTDPTAVPAGLRHHYKPEVVKLSANGPMYFDPAVWDELHQAVAEARAVLKLLDDATTKSATMKTIRAGDHPLET